MVFYSTTHAHAGATATAVSPLDVTPHDDGRRLLFSGVRGVDTKHHHHTEPSDLLGPLTTLAAAVGSVPSPLRIDTVKSKKKTKKNAKSLSPSTSTASASSDDRSIVSVKGNAKTTTKKLSTERSRLCRQRQKTHADTLEKAVAALRAEVTKLVTLRDLHREQLLHTPASRSGSLARIVHQYCSVFEFGMTPETASAASPFALSMNRKRSLASSQQLTAQEQCDFLLSIMDPEVQVFDWIGRTKRGPDPLVHGWKAWSTWHASIMFQLEGVDVISTDDDDTIAVSSRGKICVKVSPKTIEQLFPHVAHDEAICARLLDSEIRYPFRDTFYFNDTGRVVMYTVDMDCITALNNVVGDFRQVAALVAPPDDTITFNDRAVSTHDGCSLERAREARAMLPQSPQKALTPSRDHRLDLQFLLS
jgi:hypothetical protein